MLKWRNQTKDHTVLSVRLRHSMHPDRTRCQQKKCQLNYETGAKMQQTRWIQNKTNIKSSITNHHTIETIKHLNVFIRNLATECDNKNILMLGYSFSYPWLHYHLDDRNGCRLETKSLRLIRVTQTSCTAICFICHHYLWFIQHVNALKTLRSTFT